MFAVPLIAVVVLALASLRLLHSPSRQLQGLGLGCAALTIVLLAYIFVASDFLGAVSAERH